MAAGLAAKGYRVLGIDLDPQGNFSTACGAENYNVQTIYEVMKRAASIQDAIQHTKGGYDVVPANIMLAGAEQEFSQTGKEHRLKEAVAPVASDYDFIVIDTPPSLGVLTVNAFTCATDILIPTTAGIFATAAAVIDKDLASELLAEHLDADMLIILTAVEKVAVNFNKPNQKWLDTLTPEEARTYIDEGQFAPGSMLPKVEAAVKFAESKPGRTALITLLEKARDGIDGKTGTRIAC